MSPGWARYRTDRQSADEPPIFLFGHAIGISCELRDTLAVEHNDMRGGPESPKRCAANIDIVLTDINLGEPTTGWEVAERFPSERPASPCFTCQAIGLNPNDARPTACLSPKPFQHNDILTACQRLRSK